MFTQSTAQNSRQVPRQVKEKLSLYIKEAVMSFWRGERLQRQYITASVLSELIKKRCIFRDVLEFDEPTLNGAMTKHFPGIYSKNGNEPVFRSLHAINLFAPHQGEWLELTLFQYVSKTRPTTSQRCRCALCSMISNWFDVRRDLVFGMSKC